MNQIIKKGYRLQVVGCRRHKKLQAFCTDAQSASLSPITYHLSPAPRGFTILIAIVVASIVLAIALSIMSITMKQLTLAGIARESEIAFQAANAGVECIRYYDISTSNGNTFDVDPPQGSAVTITCLDGTESSAGAAASGDPQNFEWEWGDENQIVCTDVTLYKFYDENSEVPVEINGETVREEECPAGVECTVVKARGYNAPCGAIDSGRVVERELTLIY